MTCPVNNAVTECKIICLDNIMFNILTPGQSRSRVYVDPIRWKGSKVSCNKTLLLCQVVALILSYLFQCVEDHYTGHLLLQFSWSVEIIFIMPPWSHPYLDPDIVKYTSVQLVGTILIALHIPGYNLGQFGKF